MAKGKRTKISSYQDETNFSTKRRLRCRTKQIVVEDQRPSCTRWSRRVLSWINPSICRSQSVRSLGAYYCPLLLLSTSIVNCCLIVVFLRTRIKFLRSHAPLCNSEGESKIMGDITSAICKGRRSCCDVYLVDILSKKSFLVSVSSSSLDWVNYVASDGPQ